MLLDVLDQFDTVKVCVGYEKPDGEVIADFPADLKQLASCRPVYKTLRGWHVPITECRKYEDLPEEAKEVHPGNRGIHRRSGEESYP